LIASQVGASFSAPVVPFPPLLLRSYLLDSVVNNDERARCALALLSNEDQRTTRSRVYKNKSTKEDVSHQMRLKTLTSFQIAHIQV
jgi:hypothetical protein